MRAQPRPQEHSLAAGLLFCFSQGEQRKNRVLKVPRSPPGSCCAPLAGVTLNIGQGSISKRMKPIGRPALRRLQTGLPPPRAAAKGAYFGRGMAGSSFSKQLYLLGAEMMGVGPFLCPLPHLLAHPCISWCRHSRTPHPPHPSTRCLGFSSLPAPVVWLGTSRGWVNLSLGAPAAPGTARLRSQICPQVTPTGDAKHGAQSHQVTGAAGRRARSLCGCGLTR